ncbi:aminoglycoside phosphotransferase family protein [Thermocatellispora tengchongensis]
MANGSVKRMAETQPAARGSEDFTAETSRATMERACARAGLDPQGAELIRLGENAVYRLREPVIVRVSRTLAYLADVRKEVAVSRWLAEIDFPAIRALRIEQPCIIADHAVTFWESLTDVEDYGTPADVAELLVKLHELDAPAGALGLKPLDPFSRVERRINSNGWFTPEDDEYLRSRLVKLREAYSGLSFSLSSGVIHGDASVGNVIRDREGHPKLIDLDGVAIGPREWDLVLTALYYERFGWHTREEYEAFAQIYGFDVMAWDGYTVLADIREFLMVTWLSQKAAQDERVAAEVRKRIDDLKSGATGLRNWEPY